MGRFAKHGYNVPVLARPDELLVSQKKADRRLTIALHVGLLTNPTGSNAVHACLLGGICDAWDGTQSNPHWRRGEEGRGGGEGAIYLLGEQSGIASVIHRSSRTSLQLWLSGPKWYGGGVGPMVLRNVLKSTVIK